MPLIQHRRQQRKLARYLAFTIGGRHHITQSKTEITNVALIYSRVLTERRTLPVNHFADGAAFRDYFKSVYGPTISAYRAIGDDAERAAALDAAIAAVGDRFLVGPSKMEWEYLLLVARKR